MERSHDCSKGVWGRVSQAVLCKYLVESLQDGMEGPLCRHDGVVPLLMVVQRPCHLSSHRASRNGLLGNNPSCMDEEDQSRRGRKPRILETGVVGCDGVAGAGHQLLLLPDIAPSQFSGGENARLHG